MQRTPQLLPFLLLHLLATCCVISGAQPSATMTADVTGKTCKAKADNVPGPRAYRDCTLEYYLQVMVGDVSLNENLFPPLNASYSGPFGRGELFAFNATKGPEKESEIVGQVRGFTINTAYRAWQTDLLEVELLSYDDGVYKGTVQIQGEIVPPAAAPNGGDNEVAIVGGTGSFRGARGFAFITRLLVDGNYRLFRHRLHFLTAAG